MAKKVKKNGELKKSGGKRANSGRHLVYNEKTKTVAFRVPTGKSTELREFIKDRLHQYAKEARLSFSVTENELPTSSSRDRKGTFSGRWKRIGKSTVISNRVPKSKISELKLLIKIKLKEYSEGLKIDLIGK